jgi:hypothetical protein
MNFKYFLILAAVTCFGVMSCVKDTCNGALGNTFDTIDLDSAYLDTGVVTMSFSIQTLDELPESYFMDAIPVDDNTAAQINSIEVSKTHMEFTMVDSIVPAENENIDLILNFLFQDRRNYIDCQHSGSSDFYYLELMFNLERLEGDQFEVTDFFWNEIFQAGHL